MPELEIFDDGVKYTPPGNKNLYLANMKPYADEVSDVVGKKFMDWQVHSEAASGDARAQYLRLYLDTAGGGGEALRVFTTIQDVAAASAHGAHISLSLGTSGTVTGQGIAGRNTLHMPATALASNVTMAALQAEIWSDGSASDPGGSTILSFLRIVNAGHANGIADVDDDAAILDLQGFTSGAGNVFKTGAPTTLGASFRVRVGSTLYYVPLYTTQSAT